MTDEEIHNIYLHMSGKAEGLVEATGKADFPVLFARAILECEGLTKDEPVACGMEIVKIDASAPLVMTPHPAFQKRTWVGLTEEDLKPICDEWRIVYGPWVHDFAKEIEVKLKEKNNAI
jgi:hypothetical protein